MKRIIVGMSGASGSTYAILMLEMPKSTGGVETHLIMSRSGDRSAPSLLLPELRPYPDWMDEYDVECVYRDGQVRDQ